MGLALQLVPFQNATDRSVFGWEEEEDVAVRYRKIEDDVAVFVLVAAGSVPMEGCEPLAESKQALLD